MSDSSTSTASESSQVVAGAKQKPRWPVGAALLTSLLFPHATARRTGHASLCRVWLVHLAAALLAILLILFLLGWWDAGGVDGAALELARLLVSLESDSPHPLMVLLLSIAAFALCVEVGWLMLAAVVMPWGAGDEPLRMSYRNALRQTWLHTASILPVIILVWAFSAAHDHIETAWLVAHPGPSWSWPELPALPNVASGDAAYAQAMADYQAALKEYQRQIAQPNENWLEWTQSQPWYVRDPELFVVLCTFVMPLWLLWALLRSVGAPRGPSPVDRPPLCDRCGYNLTTIPLESRCPECGEPVMASLGPNARPGTVWRRRHEVGRIRAWGHCFVGAMHSPTALGRQLQLVLPGHDHRRFLALNLLLIFAIGALGLAAGTVVDVGADVLLQDPAEASIISTIFGIMCVFGAVGVTFVGALVVGWSASIHCRRNLFGGSMQVASYLSGYLVIWALMGAALTMGVIALVEQLYWLEAVEQLTGLYPSSVAVALWTLPNLACSVIYLVLVGRGTAATRYANR